MNHNGSGKQRRSSSMNAQVAVSTGVQADCIISPMTSSEQVASGRTEPDGTRFWSVSDNPDDNTGLAQAPATSGKVITMMSVSSSTLSAASSTATTTPMTMTHQQQQQQQQRTLYPITVTIDNGDEDDDGDDSNDAIQYEDDKRRSANERRLLIPKTEEGSSLSSTSGGQLGGGYNYAPPSNRPRLVRHAYGEAGSQPSIVQAASGAQHHLGAPHQNSLSDSIGDNFYDASAGPPDASSRNQLNNLDQRQKELDENGTAAALMRGLSMFLQATGGGAGVGPMLAAAAVTAATAAGTNSPPAKTAAGGVRVDNEKTKRSNKTFVEVRVVFLKIGEIDTLKEQYSADVYIQSRWREPTLDRKSPEELKTVDFTKLWSPALYIENALSEQKDSSWQSAALNERGEAYVSERRKLRGVFLENLELQNFPLDVQDLSVTVVSERPDSDVELVPDEEDPSSVNIGTFADEQEWKLYQHVEVTKKTVKIEFANQQRQHSAIQVTCRAARRPGYFYYNVFLVMFFISSISFGTFSVDCSLPQNRLQLSFTLLLTSIAFKMVINQSLPKISYLTYMDKYVLMSLVFLVMICVWHSIVPTLCYYKDPGSFYANRTENFIILAFFLVYFTGHVLFAAFVYTHAWKRRLQMSQKDREFRVRSEFYGAASKSPKNVRDHSASSVALLGVTTTPLTAPATGAALSAANNSAMPSPQFPSQQPHGVSPVHNRSYNTSNNNNYSRR